VRPIVTAPRILAYKSGAPEAGPFCYPVDFDAGRLVRFWTAPCRDYNPPVAVCTASARRWGRNDHPRWIWSNVHDWL
jgi:hypothetical protein